MTTETRTELHTADCAVLRPEGKLCGGRARSLQSTLERLLESGVRSLIIDLRRVESMDSMGARSLAGLAGRTQLRLVHVGREQRQDLNRAGLGSTSCFVHNSVEAALGELAGKRFFRRRGTFRVQEAPGTQGEPCLRVA